MVSRLPQLSNEEDPEGSPQVAAEAPPPYNSIAGDNAGKTIPLPDVSRGHFGESYLCCSAQYSIGY